MSVVTAYTDALAAAFRGEAVVVLDAEGVDLSRCGRISIVQIATPRECFLIDVLDKARDDPLVSWLRGILEDEGVTKIIHDCRMDSDALFHLLGIRLACVYDTTCWNTAITGSENQNLNTVLGNNGIKPNVMRDGNVYATNPAFWATRPLTPKMIEWAAGDVTSLFAVRDAQIARATVEQAERAVAAGEHHLTVARDAMVANVKVTYADTMREQTRQYHDAMRRLRDADPQDGSVYVDLPGGWRDPDRENAVNLLLACDWIAERNRELREQWRSFSVEHEQWRSFSLDPSNFPDI